MISEFYDNSLNELCKICSVSMIIKNDILIILNYYCKVFHVFIV